MVVVGMHFPYDFPGGVSPDTPDVLLMFWVVQLAEQIACSFDLAKQESRPALAKYY